MGWNLPNVALDRRGVRVVAGDRVRLFLRGSPMNVGETVHLGVVVNVQSDTIEVRHRGCCDRTQDVYLACKWEVIR